MTITFPDEACAVTCTRKIYLLYCWNDNSKTKHERKAFATTLLPI